MRSARFSQSLSFLLSILLVVNIASAQSISRSWSSSYNKGGSSSSVSANVQGFFYWDIYGNLQCSGNLEAMGYTSCCEWAVDIEADLEGLEACGNFNYSSENSYFNVNVNWLDDQPFCCNGSGGYADPSCGFCCAGNWDLSATPSGVQNYCANFWASQSSESFNWYGCGNIENGQYDFFFEGELQDWLTTQFCADNNNTYCNANADFYWINGQPQLDVTFNNGTTTALCTAQGDIFNIGLGFQCDNNNVIDGLLDFELANDFFSCVGSAACQASPDGGITGCANLLGQASYSSEHFSFSAYVEASSSFSTGGDSTSSPQSGQNSSCTIGVNCEGRY